MDKRVLRFGIDSHRPKACTNAASTTSLLLAMKAYNAAAASAGAFVTKSLSCRAALSQEDSSPCRSARVMAGNAANAAAWKSLMLTGVELKTASSGVVQFEGWREGDAG